MAKPHKGITLIGYSLCLLYGTSFLAYWGMSGDTPFRQHTLFIAALFLGLLFSSMGVVALKEFGRRLLIILNGILCLYFVALLLRLPNLVQPSYILMSLAAVVYFSQPRIKIIFQPERGSSRKSVLVVDDEIGILKTLKRILLPNGYSVLTATSGEKGMQIARMQKPDLIILDVILPGIKGREVCVQLKEDPQTRDIPVIFLTAKDSEDDIKAEMAVGGLSHLTKPVNAKLLLAEVKKALE